MKKWLKIVLGIVGAIVLCFALDLIFIFKVNKPLFAVNKSKDGADYKIYHGLFYDTYNCPEYSTPQIKAKGSKFTCSIDRTDSGKVLEIVDKTEKIKNFNCAQALEDFYEDNNYTYSWNCIKGQYVVVKYESGYEETVENALKSGTITIEDLDNYNIKYIKEEK